MRAAPDPVAMTSADVRAHLVEALVADLVGPYDPDSGHEILPLAPSRWYLTGFLAPQGHRDALDPTDDDELAAGSDTGEEDDAGAPDPEPKRRNIFAASIGLSVLLAPGTPQDTVEVHLRWADYVPLSGAEAEEARARFPTTMRKQTPWLRVPAAPPPLVLALDPTRLERGVAVPGSDGLEVVGRLQVANAPGLPTGTRALSLFVVNRRTPARTHKDTAFVFQVELAVRASVPFVPRPDLRDGASSELDARIADLQFRDVREYAVGHGVAVESQLSPDGSGEIRTCWLPRASVKRVVTRSEPDVVTSMEALAALEHDGEQLRAALSPLVEHYGAWIERQRSRDLEELAPGQRARAETRDVLMAQATRARARIASGIERLAGDPTVRKAFCLANEAMARSARARSPERYAAPEQVPSWRLFQLAFVLLNIDGLSDPDHEDRELVELIFFPTGGGKTEAYLGAIAFMLVLRRLRGQERADGGLGCAVLLRYTLRLLTLDQLGRAATLVCALELMRRARPQELGSVRFSIGLWVGRSASANTISEVAVRVQEFKRRRTSSPFPLPGCPWCRCAIEPRSIELLPGPTTPREVRVGCASDKCEFRFARSPEGLPVLFVDEQIYAELPSFVIGTVDKFALLPWRSEAGMLFGRGVKARVGRQFFGVSPSAHDKTRGERVTLADGLRPPELIVQDEVHLISGPLGTMVGLYETVVDALATEDKGPAPPRRPKVIASTATVRRAAAHMRALFGRTMALFPPPGVDDSESWFARVDERSEGRLYLGVAAQGRAMKAILLRVYVALLAAANRCYQDGGPPRQAADPYMTLVGYFNSLRELGGMRRLVEDEVRARCASVENRAPVSTVESHRWMRNRELRGEPGELTSRESTATIAETKAQVEKYHSDPRHIDVLLASNMISVGVDIDRLGLMVVAGQPKTTSEYIQATSRVGRDASRPGLVVTCYNIHKPRDRSHYEHFVAYHEAFYRYVEATSLTPFSGPALDRGLVGALVALTRHGDEALQPPHGVMEMPQQQHVAERAVERIASRAASVQPSLSQRDAESVRATVAARGAYVVDAWRRIVTAAQSEAGKTARQYSPWEGSQGKSLLFMPLDGDSRARPGIEGLFKAPTSMRDVEPSVHLWLRTDLSRKE